MAQLCSQCEKIFKCNGDELQDFLHFTEQTQKDEKEPSTAFDEEETHIGPSSTPTTFSSNMVKVVGVTSDCEEKDEKDIKNCEKCMDDSKSNGEDGERDTEDKEFWQTGSELQCKRRKLNDSLSIPAPTGTFEQPEKEQACCPMVQCMACLGLLEEDYIQHLIHFITQHVNHVRPLGMETFSLSIHIPLSLAACRLGMEICAQKIRSNSKDDPKSCASENNYVKEELRQILRKKLEETLSPLIYAYNSHFTITLDLEHKTSLRTCIGVKKLRPRLFPRPKKTKRSRKSLPTPITYLPLQSALKDLSSDDFVKENYFLSRISSPCSHKVTLIHDSCYIAGRYNKYSRKLSQTPWVIDGVKKSETSVQELISAVIVDAFRASSVKFSSSGREDVDVLMLGQGRPFLLELINPMDISVDQERIEKLQKEINDGTELVAVNRLMRVNRESSILLKDGEKEKRKIYSALVWTEEEVSRDQLQLLDETKDLVIQQLTPIRVLHRRTLSMREKTIFSMETEQIDAHHFTLQLGTQAGTYIKEFVHSDFGRTQPHLGTLLGCQADILRLDVLEVELEWPLSPS